MKQYETYKDSGIEWLGKVPGHWDVMRLKDYFSIGKGLPITKDDLQDSGISVVSYGQIHSKTNTGVTIAQDLVRYVDDSYLSTNPQSIVPKGGFIFADTSEDIEGSGNCIYQDREEKVFAGYHTEILFPRESDDNKYLAYLFQNEDWRCQIRSSVYGIKVMSITKAILNRCSIILPPHSEQVRIVEYLDAKCGDIDNRIAVLEKEQKAYERLKVAVINRTVTEGLNPETPKRDSGLDWLGMIPEHWEVKRSKDLGYLYSGLTGKAGDDFRCDDESLTKPYVPFTNILNNTRVSKDLLHRVVMSENEDQNKVCKGDLLFLMSSEDYESIAKSAVVSEDLGEVYLNSFCRGFRPNTPEIVSEFVNYQLYAIKYRDNLRFEARGFTRINIKIDKISSMTVTLPPYSEQKAIVEYLDTKCAAIDTKIGNIAKRIEAYKRLKRALINEVVTGKRAV